MESRTLHAVDDDPSAVEHCGLQRDAAEPLQVVADPVAAELEAVLAMRRAGADPKALTQNAAVAYRAELIDEIRLGTAAGGVPTAVPRLEMLCRSSWVTFVTENVNSKERAAKLGRVVETHILRRWGAYFIDKITVPEIDAWVRTLTTSYSPETIRHHVGLFRRILGKARGQYQLMPIDWDLITLPTVSNEHALKNRLNVEQIAASFRSSSIGTRSTRR